MAVSLRCSNLLTFHTEFHILSCALKVGAPAEEDLQNWGHHSCADTVPDAVMQKVAGDDVSFIFSCKVDGKAIEEVPYDLVNPKQQEQRPGPAASRLGAASLASKSRTLAPFKPSAPALATPSGSGRASLGPGALQTPASMPISGARTPGTSAAAMGAGRLSLTAFKPPAPGGRLSGAMTPGDAGLPPTSSSAPQACAAGGKENLHAASVAAQMKAAGGHAGVLPAVHGSGQQAQRLSQQSGGIECSGRVSAGAPRPPAVSAATPAVQQQRKTPAPSRLSLTSQKRQRLETAATARSIITVDDSDDDFM